MWSQECVRVIFIFSFGFFFLIILCELAHNILHSLPQLHNCVCYVSNKSKTTSRDWNEEDDVVDDKRREKGINVQKLHDAHFKTVNNCI